MLVVPDIVVPDIVVPDIVALFIVVVPVIVASVIVTPPVVPFNFCLRANPSLPLNAFVDPFPITKLLLIST